MTSLVSYEPPGFLDNSGSDRVIAVLLGWFIAGLSILPVPVVFVVRMSRAQGSFREVRTYSRDTFREKWKVVRWGHVRSRWGPSKEPFKGREASPLPHLFLYPTRGIVPPGKRPPSLISFSTPQGVLCPLLAGLWRPDLPTGITSSWSFPVRFF